MRISTDFTRFDTLQLDIEILAEVLKLSQELVFWVANNIYTEASPPAKNIPEAEAALQQVYKTFGLIEKEITDSVIAHAHQANRILDEAEEAFNARSRAQERATCENWGRPEKVVDYLFWIEDEAQLQEKLNGDRVYAKALQGVAQEIRALGFEPSPPPWERAESTR